jgi:hypothetical protein
MTAPRTFFIGWSAPAPGAGRRRVLGAGLSLAAGAALGAGAVWVRGRAPLGSGNWDTGVRRTLRGVLSAEPYPLLRTVDLGGAVRTVYLATDGKAAAPLAASQLGRWVSVSGTLITRDSNAMLVLEAVADAAAPEVDGLHAPLPVDRGEVLLTGEILDAKCWFGAMRPGFGKTHKACAALCVRGGLPMAFCTVGTCGSNSPALLFVDADGRPHGPGLLPWVADPVLARGRLVQLGDVTQLRVSPEALRRI